MRIGLNQGFQCEDIVWKDISNCGSVGILLISESQEQFSELSVDINCFFWQVPVATVQSSRNFHFSVYGKKNNAKVSEDVSFIHELQKGRILLIIHCLWNASCVTYIFHSSLSCSSYGPRFNAPPLVWSWCCCPFWSHHIYKNFCSGKIFEIFAFLW